MAENFLNLENENDIKVQESPRGPKKINPKRPMPQRSIIVKIAKVKAAREKVIYKGTP